MAVGKKITDLPASGSLKDTNLAIVHDGNGTKRSTLTQLSEYMGAKFSNPNLLINPDFKINQRNLSEYAYQTFGSNHYTVDRFRVVYLNVKTANDGLILNANGTNTEGGYFGQVLENAVKGDTILSFKVSAVAGTLEFRNVNSADTGNTITVSSDGIYTVKGNNTKKVVVNIAKGSSCKIEWMKLEQGSIATPFVAPNPAEEWTKCYRFKYVGAAKLRTRCTANQLYGFTKDLPTAMRTKPTVTLSQTTLFNVKDVSANINAFNNTIYLAGTSENTNQTVIETGVDLDAEIY